MLDKQYLLKPRLAEEVVDLPGLGEVRVRALSRSELHRLQSSRLTTEEADVLVLSLALVEPALTEEEAREVCQASPGKELDPIFDVVTRLTGGAEGATKSV